MTWKVPFAALDFDAQEREAVARVLESGWLSAGPVTREFEERFAEYVGARHAVAVASGTAALHLSLRALDVGPGDEVVLPSLSFVAAANAVRSVGANVVFADVESPQHLGIAAASIEARISPCTRAIVAMHYGGHACRMDAILGLARRHGIAVLEDAAHAPGAELAGRKLGSLGETGCFSFFSNKNLAAGEGGMVVTDRDELAARLRRLRSHGMTTSTWERHGGAAFSYDVTEVGLNYRIDEMRSALGLVQLGKLDEANRLRRLLTERYRTVLAGEAGLSLTCSEHPGLSSAHLFAILLDPGVDRDAFMRRLAEQGIQTSIHYPATHTFSAYREPGLEGSLPVTEEVARRIVSLPLHTRMSGTDVDFVAASIPAALGRG